MSFIFGLLFLIKIYLIYSYGPLQTPDTGGYLAFAQIISSTTEWMTQGDGLTTYRIIGYPALIALCQFISIEYWDYLLITLQTCGSLTAAFLLFYISFRYIPSYWVALIPAIGYLSSSMTCDLSILTDSLYNSLFSIVACCLILQTLNHKLLKTSQIFILGLMTGLSILLREAGIYFSCFLALLHIIAISYTQTQAKKKLLALVIFLAPIVAIYVGYSSWNQVRTGHFFLTTGTSTALFLPLIKAEQNGAHVFTENTCFDRIAREEIKTYQFEEVGTIINRLSSECQLTSFEISATVSNKFFKSLLQYPYSYLKYAMKNLPKVAILVFNPIENFWYNKSYYLEESRDTPSKKLAQFRQNFSLAALTTAILSLMSRLASTILFIVFSFGVPFLCWRDYRHKKFLDVKIATQLGIWLTFFGMHGIYWLVHWEQRYTVGVSGLFFITLFSALQNLKAQRKQSLPALQPKLRTA